MDAPPQLGGQRDGSRIGGGEGLGSRCGGSRSPIRILRGGAMGRHWGEVFRGSTEAHPQNRTPVSSASLYVAFVNIDHTNVGHGVCATICRRKGDLLVNLPGLPVGQDLHVVTCREL